MKAAEQMPVLDQITPQLDLLRQALASQTYPGYPEQSQRLVMDELEFGSNGGPNVPSDPYEVTLLADRHSWLGAMKQLRFKQLGLRLDTLGRPVHPWYEQMVLDPTIGVATGKGFYRHWGPNYTADNIVVSGDDKVLLIQRRDTGQWALPGGFVDGKESAEQAALRELSEETNLSIDQPGLEIYQGPVADIRMTAHAWPETTALLYQIDEIAPPEAGDDAAAAAWFELSDLPTQLFGSHRYLLDLAINKLGEDS